jgi:phage-related minor tail protein
MVQQKAIQIGRNFQDDLNRSFGIGGGGAQAGGATFSALEERFKQLDEIASARAAHIAQVTQQGINASFGIGATPNSAKASAAAFQEVADAEDRAAAKAAALRAAINPLDAEFARLGNELAEYRKLLDAGRISATEFEQAQVMAGKRLTDFQANLKQGANAGRVMSGELVNLSYQLNDVVTGLALGQSPFMILAQQGGQVFQIFQNSKASVVDFAKEAGSNLLGFLTVGRLAFGGVAAASVTAAVALNNYLESQNKVALSLAGAGRASGASVGSINSAANAGASLGGLSVSSARELASALAQTGKIANDNFLPIIKLGKDFQTTFGVDAVEATKMLADAFSDPVKGAEQLNDRLGFLDAAMQRQIASLVAQNRLYDAQQVLLKGVEGSLASTAQVTSIWSQMWTGLKNAASNFFDYLGEKIANGLHLNDSLKEQAEALQKQIDSFNSPLGRIFGSSADLENTKKRLAEITAEIEKQAIATNNVAAAQASLRQQATIMAQLPEIQQRQNLSDQASVAGVVAEDPLAQRLVGINGITQAQADRVRAILNQLKADYKTTFEEIQTQGKIALDAVTSFSPSAKAAIAQRQAEEQYRTAGGLDPSEKAKIGQDAYTLSIRQTTTALSEAARQRALGASQNVDSAKLEIDLVGKNIAQQNEMRANLQAQQQLEQEASQNRTKFDDAQYERLKKINVEMAKQKQLAAERQLGSDIAFDRSQIGLPDADQQINSRLRGLYGDDINSAQAQFYRQQLQINEAIRQFTDTSKDTLKGFASDFRSALQSGASAWEAFQAAGVNALNKIADKLMNMAIDNLWANAFGGSSGGGLLGLLGLGGSGLNANGSIAGAIGPTSVGGLPLVGANANGTDNWRGGLTSINERGGEIVNLPSGAQVIPHDISMRMAAGNDNGGGQQSVHVTFGVSMDDDGNLKSYVKDVSQQSAANTVNGFVRHSSFVDHVAAANAKAKTRRLG